MTLDELKSWLPHIDTDDDPQYPGVYLEGEAMPDAVGRILLALPDLIAAVEWMANLTNQDMASTPIDACDRRVAILKRLGVK